MGKTSKWLKNFLSGKKDREKEKCSTNPNFSNTSEYPATPISNRHSPTEKKRWSFRRSSTAAAVSRDSYPLEMVDKTMPVAQVTMDVDNEEKRKGLAIAVARAAAADAAVAAAQAAAAAIRLTKVAFVKATAIEEAAAIKIQTVFRSYLARKALRALRGLVKLQALARGHLVRKRAKATLRCMQALITAQARARAQRIRMIEGTSPSINKDQLGYTDLVCEENIKIVEMDHGEYKRGSKNRTIYVAEKQHENRSPVPVRLTDIDMLGCSGHYENHSISTIQSSPQDYSAEPKHNHSKTPLAFITPDCMQSLSFEYPMFPSYMANTQSSRAKARSQSAPKTRPESFERQSSRRKASSTEGKNILKGAQIQRSSSAIQDFEYPLLMKLDKSTSSLNNSECGSTSTVLTNTIYRSLVACEGNGNRYY